MAVVCFYDALGEEEDGFGTLVDDDSSSGSEVDKGVFLGRPGLGLDASPAPSRWLAIFSHDQLYVCKTGVPSFLIESRTVTVEFEGLAIILYGPSKEGHSDFGSAFFI